LSQRLGGRVLDAGSALNNSRMLDSLLPRVSELHIVTLRPERQAAWQRGVSYTFADVRELPYRDDLFAVVACVSASELWRVVKPGGSLLITVPCGRYADHGWFATLDVARLEAIAGRLCPEAFTIELFRVGRDGWRRAPASAVSGLVSRDSRREPVDRDGAVAARAVACVRLTKSAGPHGC
jgi:SAM-dependent methyltransferase